MLTTFVGPVAVSRDSPQYIIPPFSRRGNNPDLGYSVFDLGVAPIDPRAGLKRDVAPGSTWAVGIAPVSEMMLVDAVPSAIATANIAAAQATTSGTAMALVSSSGAGITVTTAAQTILATGAVVPAGVLALDGAPGVLFQGPNNSVAMPDPRTMLARAISITGSTSAPGGVFNVSGYDLYGLPQTEAITVAAGAVTQNGTKAFKFISSVTPEVTSTETYSVGTTDIYEFPVAVYEWGYARVVWAGTLETSSSGFTAADTTSPATSATGSVRGTYALPSASNGTNRLHLFASIAVYNAANANGPASVFGVVPA